MIEAEDSLYTGGYFGLMSDYSDAVFDNVYFQDLGKNEEQEEEPVVDEAFEDTFEAALEDWRLVAAQMEK